MIRRIIAALSTVCLLLGISIPVLACDEQQSGLYIRQMLFGDNAFIYEDDENVKTLLNGLYVCSIQSDKNGQEKLNMLKASKVGGIPALEKIDVSDEYLFECSHNQWEYISKDNPDQQKLRKDVLRKAVVNVFDFGWFNETFKKDQGQIDSFSALLYYFHILSDYLADDPVDTEISARGYDIPAYSGEASYEINGGIPSFTDEQKRQTESYKEYSDLDGYGRCGAGITNIGPDVLEQIEPRSSIQHIKPTGWNQKDYDGIMPQGQQLYNRCHIVAHSLGGKDTRYNLMTGTRYLNEAMEEYEGQVAKYVRTTGNHVLYRATPVYVGDNRVASGIQLEGYSVEDHGHICFNRYFYNVQPGVDINYANGSSELVDETIDSGDILPFAVSNPSDSNPDLMYAIQKQLEILFLNEQNDSSYQSMISELESAANEARSVSGNKDWEVYKKMKPLQYKYLKALSENLPELLAEENFFTAAFQ